VRQTLLHEHYTGVLTLEVFGQDDFWSSRETLLRALENSSPNLKSET
jgi:hypothetical protein